MTHPFNKIFPHKGPTNATKHFNDVLLKEEAPSEAWQQTRDKAQFNSDG